MLGPVQAIIDQIRIDDETAPPKQQHTAAQVFRRLRDEYGYRHGSKLGTIWRAGLHERPESSGRSCNPARRAFNGYPRTRFLEPCRLGDLLTKRGTQWMHELVLKARSFPDLILSVCGDLLPALMRCRHACTGSIV